MRLAALSDIHENARKREKGRENWDTMGPGPDGPEKPQAGTSVFAFFVASSQGGRMAPENRDSL